MTELPPFPFVRIQRSDPMLLLLLLEVNLKTTTAAVLQFSQNKENMELTKCPCLACLPTYITNELARLKGKGTLYVLLL